MFRRFLIASIICVAIIILYTGFTKDLYSNDVCPENMSLDQCYAHLNKKAQDLVKRSKELTQSISQEQYNQMSLAQQIEHIAGKIKDSENEIERIELELETQNVQIRILQRDIEEAQNNISTISQETNQLQNSITKRVSISYKYSFLNPLELILKTNDFEQLLRKLKYVTETRKNDRIILSDLMEQNHILDEEKDQLEKDQLALEKTRIEVEEKKSELFNEKQNLANQQATHSNLLVQSRERESKYESDLAKLDKLQDELAGQISAIIVQLFNEGRLGAGVPVNKNDIIGYQGHTGCSFGSHLHFEIYHLYGWQKVSRNPYNYLNTSNGYLVNGPNFRAPMDNALITQGFHFGYAIDLVSTNPLYANTGRFYYLTAQDIRHRCQAVPAYAEASIDFLLRNRGKEPWSFRMRGEGAPVHAIADGRVYRSYTESGGGNIVIIDHGSNLFSLYLHLR